MGWSRWWLVAMSALGASACSTCVARGTKVKTPGGERSVEDLRVGDAVTVVDPATGAQHVGAVTAIRSAQRECGRLDGLRVTSSHPLYDPLARSWAPAGEWLLGVRSHLSGLDGPVEVRHVERFVGVEEVFDLSVDHPLHTFVADGVVVHNKQPLPDTCVVTDVGRVFEETPCACPFSAESGSVSCLDDVGTCSCPPHGTVRFLSQWRTALGSTDDALRDGTTWDSVTCSERARLLEVVSGGSAAFPREGNVLRVRAEPGACGVLERPDAVGTSHWGAIYVRFDPGAVERQPLVGYDATRGPQLTALGRTTRNGGPAPYFSIGNDGWAAGTSLRHGIWYRYDWELRRYGVDEFQLIPRVYEATTGAAVLGPEQFFPLDGGTSQSLENWYQNSGRFRFTDALAAHTLALGAFPADGGAVSWLGPVALSDTGWLPP